MPGEDETPVEEPDPGEPEDEYLPTITGGGIETPVKLSDKPENVDINIATLNSKTIENILVSISGPDPFVEAVNEMKLGGEFSIVDFIGAVGEERKAQLLELGLISEEVQIKGASVYTFSIGSFMAPLALITSGGDKVYFNIKVIDSEQKEASATCTIINDVEQEAL